VTVPLAPTRIRPRLRGSFGRDLYLFAERCSSTQDLIPADAPEGAVAVAEEQAHGRGRRGRSWLAPAGTAILFSCCLRPPVESARLPSLTPLVAEAIAEALTAETELELTVKEPNDVLASGRKVAGVVAEARDGRVVLGVGINVNQEAAELPERPLYPATSLRLEAGRLLDRARLLAAVLERLERLYRLWLGDS
jgi:BirA family biotin operon repressor/biotin-[acetyl-CoA-carboxylase] ligase